MLEKDRFQVSSSLRVFAGFCVLLILPWPVGIYEFTRWVIFGAALYGLFKLHEANPLSTKNALMGLVAIVFNPIFPFYEDRLTWALLDIFAATSFYIVSNEIKKPAEKAPPSQQPALHVYKLDRVKITYFDGDAADIFYSMAVKYFSEVVIFLRKVRSEKSAPSDTDIESLRTKFQNIEKSGYWIENCFEKIEVLASNLVGISESGGNPHDSSDLADLVGRSGRLEGAAVRMLLEKERLWDRELDRTRRRFSSSKKCPFCAASLADGCDHLLLDSWMYCDYPKESGYFAGHSIQEFWRGVTLRRSSPEIEMFLAGLEKLSDKVIFDDFADINNPIFYCETADKTKMASGTAVRLAEEVIGRKTKIEDEKAGG
jgi:hypothetical protein